MTLHRPLRLFVLTLLTMATALLTDRLSPQQLTTIPGGFTRPVLALELVASDDDFTLLVTQAVARPGQGPVEASVLYRNGTYADLLFIVAYGLLWAGIPLSGLPKHARRAIRFVTVAAVVVAVAGDYVEDGGILLGLAGNPDADLIRMSALVKWAALGIAYLGMTCTFWPGDGVRDGWQLLSAAIALAYSYAGVVCLVGVLGSHPIIERVGLPILLALVLQAVAFWRAQRRAKSTPANASPLART